MLFLFWKSYNIRMMVQISDFYCHTFCWWCFHWIFLTFSSKFIFTFIDFSLVIHILLIYYYTIILYNSIGIITRTVENIVFTDVTVDFLFSAPRFHHGTILTGVGGGHYFRLPADKRHVVLTKMHDKTSLVYYYCYTHISQRRRRVTNLNGNERDGSVHILSWALIGRGDYGGSAPQNKIVCNRKKKKSYKLIISSRYDVKNCSI